MKAATLQSRLREWRTRHRECQVRAQGWHAFKDSSKHRWQGAPGTPQSRTPDETRAEHSPRTPSVCQVRSHAATRFPSASARIDIPLSSAQRGSPWLGSSRVPARLGCATTGCPGLSEARSHFLSFKVVLGQPLIISYRDPLAGRNNADQSRGTLR